MIPELFLLSLLGLVVGFFAGLLGIGGGGIMVPALTTLFIYQGINPNQVVHMALATSMSCIIFNAIISTYTHHKHLAILWPVVWRMTPFVLLGSFCAALLAVHLSSQTLAIIFAVCMLLTALQMVLNYRPKGKKQHLSIIKLGSGGTLIGGLSALLAIGGGSITVPFLYWHQINIKKCIATGAALGLPISLIATLTLMYEGQSVTIHQPNMLGFVYWPATIALILGALITTPIGANLTHRLPVKILKNVFAVLLVVLALKMYFTLA